MDDDLVLIVRMFCFILGVYFFMIGVGDQCCDDVRCGVGFGGVGVIGQDNGNVGIEYDVGGQCVGQIFELFGDYVVGFEIGDDEDFGMVGDGGFDVFGFGGNDGNGVVESQWVVEDVVGDLVVISYFVECCGIEGGLDFWIDGFNC